MTLIRSAMTPELYPADEARQDLVALRMGDPNALASCYRKYAPALLTVAYRISASVADAEDVVHDVFVGLPEALARYQEHGRFDAWLSQVTIRTALMRQRREARYDDDAPLATMAAAPALLDDALSGEYVQRALAELSPALRHVFVLRYVHDYTHAQIAALLGIAVNTSEVRLHRAVQQLRRSLGSMV